MVDSIIDYWKAAASRFGTGESYLETHRLIVVIIRQRSP
jgi:hypothetical protein